MSQSVKRLGIYELRDCLKHEPALELWDAYDPRKQQEVSIKLLTIDTRGNANYAAAFQQEVMQLSRLHHANIVELQDAQIQHGRQSDSTAAYLVTEHIEGPTLADYIHELPRSGKLPSSLVSLFASIAMAVDYAHQQGVVHGNLKPASVRIRRSAQGELEPLVDDFGLTHLLESTSGLFFRRSLDDVRYISPEQARGEQGDARSDLYSLGVILYELCTGALPFHGVRPVSLLMQHTTASPPQPALINPNVSPALTKVILRGLEKDPGRRYATASEMAFALAQAFNLPLPGHFTPQYKTMITEEPTYSSYDALNREIRAGRFLGNERPSRELQVVRAASIVPALPGRRNKNQAILFISMIALVTVFASIIGISALVNRPGSTKSGPVTSPIVGHAYFLNSGQFNERVSNQGINDQLQVKLTGITEPADGKSYYGWLLPDKKETEQPSVFLGKLTVVNGGIQLLYTSSDHKNLLELGSRFLITEENSNQEPTLPSPDTSVWRYYAELAQTPSSTAGEHASLLDHFRHLLVESPELQKLQLHGGLAIWLLQNSKQVSVLANNARNAWQQQNMVEVRNNLIKIMDYLEGKKRASRDFPPTTPYLADEQETQIPLLGKNPAKDDSDNKEGDPVGYVYLVGLHMQGAVSAPLADTDQKRAAADVNTVLSDIAVKLRGIHEKIEGLVPLDDTQMADQTVLERLNDIVAQSQEIYSGHIDQDTNQTRSGVLWVYQSIQRMINFTIKPYTNS